MNDITQQLRFNRRLSIGIILLMLFELLVALFSVNRGAANTDEFFILLQVKFQQDLMTFDVFNMLRVVYYSLFDSVSIISFRYTKIILSLITFLMTVVTLIPLLKKKYNLSFVQLLSAAYLLLTASLLTVFYRSLHYNDIMDCFSIWCILLIIRIVKCENKTIYFVFFSFLYAVSSFFLIGIKLHLGLFAMLTYVATIFLFFKGQTTFKFFIVAVYFAVLIFLIDVYIKYFYGTFDNWMNTVKVIRLIFKEYGFPLYAIDVIAFLCISFTLYRFHKVKTSFLNNVVPRITIQGVLFFVGGTQFCFLLSLMKQNNYSFMFYFLLPALVVILILLYLYSWIVKNDIIDKREPVFKNKSLYIIVVTSVFFSFILFGSLTLQIVNVLLHPLPLIVLFLLITLYLEKTEPLYVMSILFVICFFCFNICNPFLYNNRTLLNQKYCYQFQSPNDKIWIDSMSCDYYTKVNLCLDSFQDKYVVNLDFGNVLFNSKLKPFLIPNAVDEEEPEIYGNGLHLIKEYKKVQYKPSLLFASSPVDKKYFQILESECQVKKGRLLFSIKDPSANCFKFLKTNGNLYIYELVHI